MKNTPRVNVYKSVMDSIKRGEPTEKQWFDKKSQKAFKLKLECVEVRTDEQGNKWVKI